MLKSTQSVTFEGEGSIALGADIIQPEHGNGEGIRTVRRTSDEDLARALFILLIPIVLIDVLFRALSRALWFDEILTKLVSSQPNVEAMWYRLSHGVTSHPPTFYLIEHVIAGVGGNDRITFRLVSIAAFLCVMMCMFIFVRRRTGGLIAVISASALLLTHLYNFYAFEARPYAVMAACIAIALLCYDRVDSWAGAALFAVCLVAASSLNFYAGLSFFPFGLAELVRFVTERKFRPLVWLGFLAGLLPYIPFWPLLREQKLLFGVHSFGAPSLFGLAKSLGDLMRLDAYFASALFGATLSYLIYLAFSGV
jgi:4-amino-4-deoxy-L-arabinose transferase-like glycosyltransferase